MSPGLAPLPTAGGLALAPPLAVPAARAAEPFTLTSPAYQDNAPLQSKSAGNNKQNANCVRDNISPPLHWANAPEGTKSFVLLMFDPQRARRGSACLIW